MGAGIRDRDGGGRAPLRIVDLTLPRVAGITHVDNMASQRVLEKIGLHRHGTRFFTHPAYAANGPMAFFEREAADWLAER